MILGTMLIVSLGVNGLLYYQLSSKNKSITGINTEIASIQKEYDALSLKIKDAK